MHWYCLSSSKEASVLVLTRPVKELKLDAKSVKQGIDQLCLLAELPRPPTVRVDMRNLVEILVKILKGPPRPPTISTKTMITTTTTHS